MAAWLSANSRRRLHESLGSTGLLELLSHQALLMVLGYILHSLIMDFISP